MNRLDPSGYTDRVRAALDEDGAAADATVTLLGIAQTPVRAELLAGVPCVVAGLDVAAYAFGALSDDITVKARKGDGARAAADDVLLAIDGPAGAVLGAERVALNFLQRLSGIATLTAAFVDRVKGTGVTILDTRKTTPLWRDMEKYAVRCGGGQNHRRDLGAMALVKENHVRAAGGATALRARLDASAGNGFVEVEVDSLAMLDALLGAPIDRIMLDNFTPSLVAVALERIDRWRAEHGGNRIEIEVSGGITLETVRDYAQPGVDFISVGALTHSAPAVAMSLEVR